jgi:hypothetical protein
MKTITKFTCPALAVLALVCFAVLSTAQAVTPPPDGGYTGGNTAEGTDALLNLASGVWNTAVGAQALNHDTTGHQNTATGYQSLFSNTIGGQNTASGVRSLFSNITGNYNTADGYQALARNTSGIANTAVGLQALWRNTEGIANTAIGAEALTHNTTAEQNTAIGSNALEQNRIGNGNTAMGYAALDRNMTGSTNTAIGHLALYNSSTGGSNTAIRDRTGFNIFDASNVTCIGANVGGANVSSTTWIGGVYGVTTQSGTTAPVIVSANGQLGTVASSERFKKDIATMDKASETILSLRPVTFHYKTDAKGTPQFGLIAEEVAKVNPALVVPDKDGKPYSVRYEAVNALLLNEFLKEHATVQELKKEIAALKAGLQTVSAQVELSKPAPQTAQANR